MFLSSYKWQSSRNLIKVAYSSYSVQKALKKSRGIEQLKRCEHKNQDEENSMSYVNYINNYMVIGPIGLANRVFANIPGDRGSILGRVIPETLKMVLGCSLLNTPQYKVRIKGKVEQSRERSSVLPYTLV